MKRVAPFGTVIFTYRLVVRGVQAVPGLKSQSILSADRVIIPASSLQLSFCLQR